jgi:hypothetical protein
MHSVLSEESVRVGNSGDPHAVRLQQMLVESQRRLFAALREMVDIVRASALTGVAFGGGLLRASALGAYVARPTLTAQSRACLCAEPLIALINAQRAAALYHPHGLATFGGRGWSSGVDLAAQDRFHSMVRSCVARRAPPTDVVGPGCTLR